MSPITSHVLDTSLGRPASGLVVELSMIEADGSWRVLAEQATNAQGRASELLGGRALERGAYRLRFNTRAYFEAHGQPVFYPYVDVIFTIDAPDEHYHVPLLLSPFGYSTYRGS